MTPLARSYSLAVAAALLAACQAAPAPVAAGAPGALGAPVAQAPATGRISVTPSVKPGGVRQLLAILNPYTDASIDHLVVKLVDQADSGNPVASVSVPAVDLYNTLTFGNLVNGHTYDVKAIAYMAAAEVTANIISDPATSFVTVAVGSDDRPAVGNLVVNLIDRTFSGAAASSGLAVQVGDVVHTGSVGSTFHASPRFDTLDTRVGAGPLGALTAIAEDADGDLFFTDRTRSVVWRLPAGSSTPEVFAGTLNQSSTSVLGTGTGAAFRSLRTIAIARDGTLFVADAGAILKITNPGAVVTLVAGSLTAAGDVPAAGNGPETDPTAARFFTPYGLAVDADGSLIVADTFNHAIRRVTQAGEVSNLFRAGLSAPRAVSVGRDGLIYVADTDNHRIKRGPAGGALTNFAGDGGSTWLDAPTALSARIGHPACLAFDLAGNLYVGSASTIRRVGTNGAVTTIAGDPGDVGLADGSTYQGVGDFGSGRLDSVVGLAIDAAGVLSVADTGSGRIRRVRYAP